LPSDGFVDHLRAGFAIPEAAPDPLADLLERGEAQSAAEMIMADAFANSL
jgi:hypothetical protein